VENKTESRTVVKGVVVGRDLLFSASHNMTTIPQSDGGDTSEAKTGDLDKGSIEKNRPIQAVVQPLTQSTFIKIYPTPKTTTTSGTNDGNLSKEGGMKTSQEDENTGNDRVTIEEPNGPLVANTKIGMESERSEKTTKLTASQSKSQSYSPFSAAGAAISVVPKIGTTPLQAALTQPPSKLEGQSTSTASTTMMKRASQDTKGSLLSSSGSVAVASSTIDNSSVTPPPAPAASGIDCSDEHSKLEEALKKERKPLTDLYSPFVSHSDTTLEDARRRLRIALDQTRQLRGAFTERVYGKYRVCLKPPPQTEDILDAIKKDPNGMVQKLQHEIKQTKLEKEFEKKEAQKLNNHLPPGSSIEQPVPPSSNTTDLATCSSSIAGASVSADGFAVDQSDDLMYVTGGLSLVILPESNASHIDMSMYRERAPIHPETRQRVRSISAAAAAAGEFMLEKARKGQLLRIEREKRRQEQYSGGEAMERDEYFDGNYARHSQTQGILVPVIAAKANPLPPEFQTSAEKSVAPSQSAKEIAVSTAKTSEVGKSAKRSSTNKTVKSTLGLTSAGGSAANIKVIRARVQANMSLNTLLSLDPSDEELRTDGKYSQATKAIFERGVGVPASACAPKGSQSRIRHPFPDSLGGRRRFVSSTSNASRVTQVTTPKDLLLMLPPKPTCKERRRQKKIPVLDPSFAASSRADLAIRRVLNQFSLAPNKNADQVEFRPRKQRITEIAFMHGVHLNQQAALKSNSESTFSHAGGSVNDCPTQDIDQMLALNVLNAVGLVTSCTRDDDIKKIDFQATFKNQLFDEDRMRFLGLPMQGGAFSQSVSKVNKARKSFSATKRNFTDAFFSERAQNDSSHGEHGTAAKENELTIAHFSDKTANPLPTPSTAFVELRGGGGDGGLDSGEGGKKSNQSAEPAVEIGSGGNSFRGSQSDIPQRSNHNNNAINASIHRDLSSQCVVWDERSQQLVVQSPMARNGTVVQSPGSQFQVQLHQAEHYHQTNALQLAHQLRISRLPYPGTQTTGDLSEYMGGLHRTQAQAAYDWSSATAANAAAAVASSHSLAALGLNQHRSAIVPLSAQDRTRVLLAREQQTFAAHAAAAQHQQAVALMSGAGGAAVHTYASSGFPHLAGQLLNPSNPGLLGHPGIQRFRFANAPQEAPNNSPSRTNSIQLVQRSSGNAHSILTKNVQTSHDWKTNADVVQKSASSNKDEINESGQKSAADNQEDNHPPSEAGKKRRRSENDVVDKNPGEKKPVVSEIDEGSRPRGTEIVNDENEPRASLDQAAPLAVPDEKIVREYPVIVDDNCNISNEKDGRVIPPKLVADPAADDSHAKVTSSRLQYFVPVASADIASEVATLILSAKCHDAIQTLGLPGEFGPEGSRIVDYIVSVGTAVPIPKTMVLNLVKDRLNAPAFKNSGVCSIPALSRDVIVAVILLWLWQNQEDSFQRAFSKSGRIDVDPECKWFVTAAVDKAVSALAAEVTELSSRSNKPLAAALLAHKNKSSIGQKGGEADSFSATSTRIDLLAAAIVSKALNSGLIIDEEMVRRRMLFANYCFSFFHHKQLTNCFS
jgi:hypothetical protein